MANNPLTVAWISDFPVEWLPDLPEPLRALPRRHPATWQRTMLSEFENDASVRLHVISLQKKIARDVSFARNNVTFHVLKSLPMMRLGSLFWLDTFLIRRLCRRIKPDLIHAWGSEKGAALIAHRLAYPYVATVQGLFSWYKTKAPLTPSERVLELLERRSLRKASIVTGESTFTVRYLMAHFPHLQVRHVEQAPNWAFHHVLRRPQTNPFHFIFNGVLCYRKGTDLLFAALDRLTPVFPFRLTVICGPDPDYLNSMRSSVSGETWKRIEFKHHLQPHQIVGELETPAMMLMPTRADTGPMAVKEAALAGVPVVASDVGGIPDYVLPGKNGFLFPSNDVSEFVRAIKSACEHPLFGKGLVNADTLARLRADLSPTTAAHRIMEAYKAALQRQPH